VAALALAACSSGDSGSSSEPSTQPTQSGTASGSLHDLLPADVQDAGRIVVAIEAAFPPMEFKHPNDGSFDGFDVDLANEIGKRLGVTIEFQDQAFDQLINSVATGRADMLLSALSDTGEREQRLDFIDYFYSGALAFTSQEQSATVTDLSALCGELVAMSKGTDFVQTFESWSQENCPADQQIQIGEFPGSQESRLQVVQGRAAAAVEGPDTFGWLVKQQPDSFVAIPPVLNPTPYGMGFVKGNDVLRDAVFAAVQEIFADGTYQTLLDKWQLSDGAVPEPVINGAPAGT
jgi:polar amino acid transport system substrate-binding protein